MKTVLFVIILIFSNQSFAESLEQNEDSRETASLYSGLPSLIVLGISVEVASRVFFFVKDYRFPESVHWLADRFGDTSTQFQWVLFGEIVLSYWNNS